MTLDEAIQRSKKVANELEIKSEIDVELSKNIQQYTEWLEELQRYRFEISECKAILDRPTPDVTENDRKRAMYVLQTFPDVRGEQYEN